jgi:hypothetical protein
MGRADRLFGRLVFDHHFFFVLLSLSRRCLSRSLSSSGVNDSPAIKQADVGIAMGLGGTEVTRQASDIILSDDNFSTIVSSVGEGRRIYDNIVKFLVYLLTCNGAEVWVMLFAVILGMPVPFLSLMLLWANIFASVKNLTLAARMRPRWRVTASIAVCSRSSSCVPFSCSVISLPPCPSVWRRAKWTR